MPFLLGDPFLGCDFTQKRSPLAHPLARPHKMWSVVMGASWNQGSTTTIPCTIKELKAWIQNKIESISIDNLERAM